MIMPALSCPAGRLMAAAKIGRCDLVLARRHLGGDNRAAIKSRTSFWKAIFGVEKQDER